MSYQNFKVEEIDQGKIIKVTMNRPKAYNSMNPQFFKEIQAIFGRINQLENARVAVLVSQGRIFTAGLDLNDTGDLFTFNPTEDDVARYSKKTFQSILRLQKSLLSIAECRVPVLVGIHSKCIGGGVDLSSMCDIRYCTTDTQIIIKEIDIGLAADLGTMQFMPNIIGNQSAYRELAFTGRPLLAKEAKQIGFVSRVFENKEQMEKELLLTAKAIAEKSPVGIYTLKQVMKREQFKKVHEGLDYIARTNSSMINTRDVIESVQAFMQKRKPQFGKL